VTHWSAVRQSATGWRIVLLTSSAREVLESVLTPALIMWRQVEQISMSVITFGLYREASMWFWC